DMNVRAARAYCPGHVKSRLPGHLKVQQDDVGQGRVRHLNGFFACGGFSNHLKIQLRRQQSPESLAKHGMVINNESAHCLHMAHGSSTGKCARTIVPPSGGESTAHQPPSSAARSRIESIPTPAWYCAGNPSPLSAISSVRASALSRRTE